MRGSRGEEGGGKMERGRVREERNFKKNTIDFSKLSFSGALFLRLCSLA